MDEKEFIKVRSLSLITIIGLFIIFAIIFLNTYNSLTGYIINQNNERTIDFLFYDNNTNCVLNGEIYVDNQIIGKTERGNLIINQSIYKHNFRNNSRLSIKGLTNECYITNRNLPFYREFIIPDLNNLFGGVTNIKLNSKIIPRMPTYNEEMQGFIRPNETKEYLKTFNIESNNTEQVIDKIMKFNMRYRSDFVQFNIVDYWQTPKETINSGHGDCEDWAVTLISMIKEKIPDSRCYNLHWQSHISIFCFIKGKYIIYDQDGTKFSESLRNDYSSLENKALLRRMRDNYFTSYGFKNKEKNIIAAISDKEIIKFNSDDELIDWWLNFR